MNKVKLLPCPCCGGKAKLCQWRDTENPNATWVECTNCGLMTDSYHATEAPDAATRASVIWNTRMDARPDSAALEVALEALRHYADQGSWSVEPNPNDDSRDCLTLGGNGYDIAREALAKIGE